VDSNAVIRTYPDLESVSHAAAEEFTKIGRTAIADTGRFAVVLAGGSTPRRLYERLAGTSFREEIVWDKVEFFWGDERAVSPEHPDSNYRMANDVMLKHLNIAETRIHRMSAEQPDLDTAARDYQAEIACGFDTVSDGDAPCFDLVLLGMGADGHTASLFPHAGAVRETKRWVVPTRMPQSDSLRLTLTPTIINNAKNVVFLVAGANKAETLAQVLNGPYEPERLPAQLIRPVSGNITWLIDEDAARQLPHHSSEGARGTILS
jgi:6-phosphogluconolactonase